MKFVGSIVAFAASASALHKSCATAVAAMDGVPVNTTFPAFTDAPGSVDAPFETLCGTNSYYQDFFFTYTATCTGSGLVSFVGNVNMSRITLAVTKGTCEVPVLAGQSDSSSAYLEADMSNFCDDTSPFCSDGGICSQRHQFVAELGQVYTFAAARYNSNNITGNFPGEEFFETVVQCSAPASNDCAAPTEVEEGIFTYSNLGGAASSECTNGNDVFLEYTATCTGSVNFTMVPGPGYDGYHGEDLKMGFYTACGSENIVVCQDDPAQINANASTVEEDWGPTRGPNNAGLVGGVTKGTKYTLQVGSYGSDVAPFVFVISPCEGDGSDPSSAVTLAAPLFALFAMLF